MRYRRLTLLIIVLMTVMLLLGTAAAGGENLFYNLTFSEDEQGGIDNWRLTDGAGFSSYKQTEYGVVARIDTHGNSRVTLEQDVMVQGDTNYGIRFRARIAKGTGSIRVIIADYPSAQSPVVTQSGWTVVDFYGKTSPDHQSIPVAFVLESAGSESCVAEIAQMEMTQTDNIPGDATYVWFYDRQAYVAEHKPEQAAKSIAGLPVLLVIALVYAIVAYAVSRIRPDEPKVDRRRRVIMLLGGCFVISSVLSFLYMGHSTDINNFSAWAQQLGDVGIPNFYTSGMWADYPPGYMYVLYLCGLLGKLLGVAHGHPLFTFIIKLPAILADIGCAYLVYRLARKHFSERVSLMLCALMALNPMVLLDSAIWGQMDSVLTLCLALALFFYFRGNKPVCAALLVFGVLIKPQMLVFGPLIFVAYVVDIVRSPKSGLKSLGLSLLAGAGVILAVALPFSKGQEPLWLLNMYQSAANLYRYATVNAFNFYALLGMNWVPDTKAVLLGITASQLGLVFIVLVCAFAAFLYVRAGDKRTLLPLCGLVMWGIFAFSQNMHERYLFPAILLFMLSYADTKNRRYLFAAVIATAVTFLNSGIVLWNDSNLLVGSPFAVIAISALNLFGFGYAAFACILGRKPLLNQPSVEPNPDDPEDPQTQIQSAPFVLRTWERSGERMRKPDYLIMLVITAIYAAVALLNLGSTKVPSSYWRPLAREESVLVDFGKQVDIASCYYYPGVGLGRIELSPSADGLTFLEATRIEIGGFDMYSWQTSAFDASARYVRITAIDAKVLINEMAFLTAEGDMLPVVLASPMGIAPTTKASALFDEAQMVDQNPDYSTEMYFDEVYHARTAFEHLHGFAPYENTHPPLGKVFIMLGIWLFGMNPFGWRIIGTLFGIFMLPMLYVFAKRLFRDTRAASVACLLFAVDGMHFAQTRIATIDVYGVFFIIAMCYFMFRYYQMNFFIDPLRKTLVPLGLSGILFGIGSASKWIGLYAGAGLAVAFFTSLCMRYIEYRRALVHLPHAQGEDEALCRSVVDTFWPKVFKTGLFCVLFFIVIPVAIYLLSYLPYILCAEKPYTLKGVWDIQTYMFSYHSNLTATHPFQSPWFSWPFVIRPIYFFAGEGLPEGTMQAIASFGNPIVWWAGFISLIAVAAVIATKRADKQQRSAYAFVLICLGAAFLPWTLITRATFIYHYFASVPFIILLTASLVLYTKKRSLPIWAWALCIVSAAVFALFYPVLSGLPISRAFALKWMKWLPTWWFFS